MEKLLVFMGSLIVALAAVIPRPPALAADGDGAPPKYHLNEAGLNLVFEVRDSLDIQGGALLRKDGGELNLSGGRLVATDPLAFCQTAPLTVEVPPGRYPVALFIKKTNEEEGDLYVTVLAAVFFNDNPARRWEMAVTADDPPLAEIEEGGYVGYLSPTGLGAFMSAETAELCRAEAEREPPPEGGLHDRLTRLMDDAFTESYRTGDYYGTVMRVFKVVAREAAGLNLAAFPLGHGVGGRYHPSYFGYDADGNLCCLVSDFLVLKENQAAENDD